MRASSDYRVAGGLAVVTGAASGIGAAVASRLAQQGSDLVLVDRDETGLAQVGHTIASRSGQVRVTTIVCDLSERDAADHVSAQVAREQPGVTLLVNNAGVALAGRFEQVSMDDVDWLMSINLRATMALTSAFLPQMRAGAHITSLSSLFGIIAPVGNAAYAASKFGFNQALRAELRPRGIGVTTVHPGGIATAIARNARRGHAVSDTEWSSGMAMFDRFLTIDPDDAGRLIVRGTVRRRPRVLIGPEAYVGDAVARLAPAGSTAIFEGLMRLRARSARI